MSYICNKQKPLDSKWLAITDTQRNQDQIQFQQSWSALINDSLNV